MIKRTWIEIKKRTKRKRESREKKKDEYRQKGMKKKTKVEIHTHKKNTQDKTQHKAHTTR